MPKTQANNHLDYNNLLFSLYFFPFLHPIFAIFFFFSLFLRFPLLTECRKQKENEAIHLIGFSSIAPPFHTIPHRIVSYHTKLVEERVAKNIAHQVVFKYFYFDWVFHIKHDCRSQTPSSLHTLQKKQINKNEPKRISFNVKLFVCVWLVRQCNFN